MKVDAYTKAVLTVIAVCLSVLTIQQLDLIPKAYASEPINNLEYPRYGLIPLNEDGSITVRLAPTEEIDVNIVDISTSDELSVNIESISTSDELDINIDEVGGSNIYSGGPIKVEIDD